VELIQALARYGISTPLIEANVAHARITAATAATDVARLAHQLHGATGITREYPLHRLTRRLRAWPDTETAEHE
jgi:acyl-CoA dehydrogenase